MLTLSGSETERRLREAASASGDRVVVAVPGEPCAASVLVEVLRKRADRPGAGGLTISDLRVVGPVDMPGAKLPFMVRFHNCRFDAPIQLPMAQIGGLMFVRCQLNGIAVPHAEVGFMLVVRECTFADGSSLDLRHAQVQGGVLILHSSLRLPGGVAIAADQSMVAGNVRLDAVDVEGEVRFAGAEIAGQMVAEAASLVRPGADALCLNGATVKGGLRFRTLKLFGRFSGVGMKIGGRVVVESSTFRNLGNGSIDVGGASFADNLRFGPKNVAAGRVSFDSVTAEGSIDVIDCQLGSVAGSAIDFGRARIGGSLRVMDCKVDVGGLAFRGATIGGALRIVRTSARNQRGSVVTCDSASVARSLMFENCELEGVVHLGGSTVGGRVSFRDGWIDNAGQVALACQYATVTHDLRLDGVRLRGKVTLLSARIHGNVVLHPTEISEALVLNGLRCDDSVFFASDSSFAEVRMVSATVGGMVAARGSFNGRPTALNLTSTTCRDLELTFETAPAGNVVLNNAHAASFLDRPRTWARAYWLDGFAYERFHPRASRDARQRLRWLRRDAVGYAPQPYESLAKALAAAGQEDDVRRVKIAKRRAEARVRTAGPRFRAWLFDMAVAFGYRPWQAGIWLLVLFGIGWGLFGGPLRDDFVPRHPYEVHAAFNPPVYGADLLLPVVSLGQRDAWVATHAAATWSWLMILAGWALTTAVVAGLTAALRRD